MFHLPDTLSLREHILVIGVGGGGGNALNHIIESGVAGVEFVAANTDARALDANQAPHKIILGEKLTKGRGAGADPQVGMDAAKESVDRIREYVDGADMVFVTAGMGGGTGTGAAPIIADLARDAGSLVVGVVTAPFTFEMKQRAAVAREGIANLRDKVDALLVVENDKLLTYADENTTAEGAFEMANEVLRQAVQGVTDLILKTGQVNVDFADVKTVMKKAGSAIMGIGEGEGDKGAVEAAKAAIRSPLMSLPLKGAKGILMNIETGKGAKLLEMTAAAQLIDEMANDDARFIWGHTVSEELGNKIRVIVIATGFNEKGGEPQLPKKTRLEPHLGRPLLGDRVRAITLDEQDVMPPSYDGDMFHGVPKDMFDSPAILRRKPKE